MCEFHYVSGMCLLMLCLLVLKYVFLRFFYFLQIMKNYCHRTIFGEVANSVLGDHYLIFAYFVKNFEGNILIFSRVNAVCGVLLSVSWCTISSLVPVRDCVTCLDFR